MCLSSLAPHSPDCTINYETLILFFLIIFYFIDRGHCAIADDYDFQVKALIDNILDFLNYSTFSSLTDTLSILNTWKASKKCLILFLVGHHWYTSEMNNWFPSPPMPGVKFQLSSLHLSLRETSSTYTLTKLVILKSLHYESYPATKIIDLQILHILDLILDIWNFSANTII